MYWSKTHNASVQDVDTSTYGLDPLGEPNALVVVYDQGLKQISPQDHPDHSRVLTL